MNRARSVSRIATLIALSLGSACDKGKPGAGLKTPDYVIEESATATASEENPQVVRGNTFEDFYYAFTLERPNEDWQFLTGEKAARISPDATMAMMSAKSGAFVMIIAETLGNSSLQDYSDLILSPDSMLGADGDPPAEASLGDLKAIRKETPAMVAGTPFKYRLALTERGGCFYQILGWAMETNYVTAKSEIEAVISSFRPVESREPTLRPNLVTDDANGFGWKIENGIYSNAASGVRIKNTPGCRIMGQAELANVNPNAAAGIAGGLSQFYQLWFMEHGDEALAEHQVQALAEELGGNLEQKRQVKVGALDATEAVLDNVKMGNVSFSYRLSWLVRDGEVFRIMSWWQSEAEQNALKLLDASYESVEWLDETQRRQLALELDKLDPGNSVGADFAMRNKVFYDFAGGYQLQLGGGVFETTTPSQQQLANRLEFTNLATSSYFEINIDQIDIGQHAEHHRNMTENTEAQPVETLTIANMEFLMSSYVSESDGLKFSHIYVSNADRKRVFMMWATSVGESSNELRDELLTVLRGFKRPERMVTLQRGSQRYTDYRLGYTMDVPSGWKVQSMPMGDADAMGSAVMLEKGQSACTAIVMCSPAGIDLDLATQGMLGNMGVQFDGDKEKDSQGVLAGLPANRKTLVGRMGNKAVTIYIWTAKRAHSGYILFIIDDESMGAKKAEEMAALLKRMD